MQTNRQTALAIGLAVMCAAGLTAQSQETKTTTKTKVEIKGGKDVTVIGCLERRLNGGYFLTEVRERVEIKGKAVVNGHGKASVESKTNTEFEHGSDRETKTKTEATSGELDLPLLGVKSLKTIATSCP